VSHTNVHKVINRQTALPNEHLSASHRLLIVGVAWKVRPYVIIYAQSMISKTYYLSATFPLNVQHRIRNENIYIIYKYRYYFNNYLVLLPINLLYFKPCMYKLLENPSTTASSSIAVEVFFQFKKHLWVGEFWFFVNDC